MSTNQGPDPAPIPAPYKPPTLVSTLPHHVRVQEAQRALAEFTKHVHLGPKLFAEWEREAGAELDAALAASNALDQPQMDAERERQFEIAERVAIGRLQSMMAVKAEASRRYRDSMPAEKKAEVAARATEKRSTSVTPRKPVDPVAKAEQNRKYREKLKARKAH